MRLQVNSELCQGHNRCMVLLPELIEADDEGYAVVLEDGSVPEELLHKAQLAVDNCPEFALTLEDD
ncbi:ferredoxin [Cumulibacter soli]|uniref:ferredoxin n=1 Tax=Cumulibacter soli TaxID=2546344 RepID=UPI0010684108|nr:ferredoxin [Cumulibacter soli]